MQLAGSADYVNGQVTASTLLGMSPANQSRAAGASTPPVTVAGGDRAMVWWHPDSPDFWLVVVAAATIFGMAGADVRVRLLGRRAAVSVGET